MIVFSTCWYILKAKFDKNTYANWISNFLSNVNNFKLVIYTNQKSLYMIEPYRHNPNIKIVLLEIEEFYNYKYKDFWLKNHEKNHLLNKTTCWELNMLWSEKLSFVKKTIDENCFEGEWFGWCDIGYFRCSTNYEIKPYQIKNWPNNSIIISFDKEKVYYSLCRNDSININLLISIVNNKNSKNLPIIPISNDLWCVAGGFFILYKNKMKWWHETYTNKLELYFNNDYLVKDDQIIIVDCVFSDINNFNLIQDKSIAQPWFIFQRFLL